MAYVSFISLSDFEGLTNNDSLVNDQILYPMEYYEDLHAKTIFVYKQIGYKVYGTKVIIDEDDNILYKGKKIDIADFQQRFLFGIPSKKALQLIEPLHLCKMKMDMMLSY